MKTVITIYHSKVIKNGIPHRENHIMASCKSEPPHKMDCERFVSSENSYTLKEDLKSFFDRLKTVVYEDELLECSVIDNRDFSLPVFLY